MSSANSASTSDIGVLVTVRPAVAIVLTQDCDGLRSPLITLAEVRDFKTVERFLKDQQPGSKNWVKRVTSTAKVNQKWFYLPADGGLGFQIPMGADFTSTATIERAGLETLRDGYRIGRLNSVALPHFRERLSDFFRRYAYDEWYPLTKAELDIYREDKKGSFEDIPPYPWQKD